MQFRNSYLHEGLGRTRYMDLRLLNTTEYTKTLYNNGTLLYKMRDITTISQTVYCTYWCIDLSQHFQFYLLYVEWFHFETAMYTLVYTANLGAYGSQTKQWNVQKVLG